MATQDVLLAPGREQHATPSSPTKDGTPFWQRALSTVGPGLMVCLADTDGPCLLTAATSGAEWGYSLLLLQLVLVPVLYMAQELTVRLGLIKGKGLVGSLREEVGAISAWVVAVPLLCSCAIGLASEYSVMGHLMSQLWNVPVLASNSVVTLILSALVLSGSYWVAEKVGLLMGVCQVVVFVTMFMAGPSGEQMEREMVSFPLDNPGFVKLITANIGAVIMPWMLAYQQSAICNKGLSDHWEQHLLLGRIDTALGSLITQGVMVAMLITVAATTKAGIAVDDINDLVVIFTEVLHSENTARWLLTFAMLGACMVAAIVQTLCGAWVVEEAVAGAIRGRSSASEGHDDARGIFGAVADHMRERPVFHLGYFVVCSGAFGFTMIMSDAVNVSVVTEFLNGLFMPPVIFALWYLASFKLPPGHRLETLYSLVTFVLFAVCSGFCIVSLFFTFEDRQVEQKQISLCGMHSGGLHLRDPQRHLSLRGIHRWALHFDRHRLWMEPC